MLKDIVHSELPASTNSNIEVSIVIPVYRSSEHLNELHLRLTKVMREEKRNYEIIFVEDCGGDQSWDIITQLADSDPHLKGIKLSRNFGQHAATICGISEANGRWIVTLDDDMEHPVESIPVLLAKAREGYSLVYGVYPERTHAKWRNVTSDIARRAFNKAIPSLNHEYTSFRVIDATVAKALSKFDSPFPFVDGYLSWITNNYSTVKIEHQNRANGSSNYTLRKLLLHTANIFVTFSDIPLKLASFAGVLFFLIGMIWLAIVVAGRLFGFITVSGFSSIMAAIILFGGIQLLILGIIGEYLGRMNFKLSRKPLFLIAESTKQSKQSKQEIQ
jgi:glycosyltransferase involved in cell wall biosynthesis